MADRYLLESGSPDGYLLEDGTGVLLLNNSIAWERDTSSLDFSIDDTGLIATHVVTGTDGLVRANTGHTTGDYSYTVITGGTAGTSLVGLANASEITTNFCGGSANSIGWFFSDGDVYRGGSIILSPATVWVDGDTLTVRIKNGNLYLAKNGTYIGTMNPVAETGGVDVSTMGTLYPAVSVNAGKTLTADFTNWVTAAGTTVSPAKGHLAFTGYQPAITTTNVIAPATGHLTFGGKVPSVTRTTVLSPSTGHLTFGGKTPTISVGTLVNPLVGHLTFTGYVPTITRTTAITPSTGHLTFGGKVPTVTRAVNLTPSTAHLAFTGKTPSLALGITPATGHLAFTGYVPDVSGAVVASSAQPLKVQYRHRNRNG